MTVLCLGILTGCSLPPLESRSASQALAPDAARDTALGRAIAPLAAQHPGKSGIHPLADAHDAFAARMMLARAAQRSLDVQYYIWHDDLTGTLLLEALHAAADRGVRVRLLLDDNGTAGLDKVLAALDAHPNIEVRLYNPFVVRWPKFIGYLTDFRRLNRRMHNKSFTADNQATIVGGRNIGDEYFGATDGVLFTDLDVLAVGDAVQDVSNDFDRYWASESAYPVDRLLKPAGPDELAALARTATTLERSPEAAAYAEAMRQLPFIQQLLRGELALEWAPTRMVSDDPRKTLGTAPPEAMLSHQLQDIIGTPTTDVELVSPYFVPTASGTEAFAAMAQRGVKVRVLTNALEATDVAVVHFRLRLAPPRPAGRRRRAVRDEAAAGRGRAQQEPGTVRQLGIEPACQDLRGRRTQRVRRFVQFRSAFGASEYRTGLCHRQPDAGAPHRQGLRRGHCAHRLPRLPGRQGRAVLAGAARWPEHPPRHRTGHHRLAALFGLVRVAAANRIAAVA